MMTSYFSAFIRANKVKSAALVLSIALYFALVVVAASLHRAVPELARLPLQAIGIQTMVQKNGEIPGQMSGAIFPHANAPISAEQFGQLAALPFVEAADMGLYFWYFDDSFFKAGFGITPQAGIFNAILAANLERGRLELGQKRIVITAAFAARPGLEVGDQLLLGEEGYPISAILRPNISGNIIPADFYLDLDDARAITRSSPEMARLYPLADQGEFGNVVLLRDDPGQAADPESKEQLIKALDNKLLVFSERTFTKEIGAQLGLISEAGRLLFLVLGAILALAFALLTLFGLKTREREIGILRMIGWRIGDLKRQFIGENLILLAAALVLGAFLATLGLFTLAQQTVSMELPWDISARPHFLPEENSIDRVVSAPLPLQFEPAIFAAAGAGFMVLFLAVSLLCFRRLERIKPSEFS